MTKTDSLINLVNSLSKAEKAKFNSLYSGMNNVYLILYGLIDKNRSITSENLKQEFLRICPNASFNTAVRYLYSLLLETIVSIHHSPFSQLLEKLNLAEIFFPRGMYNEALSILRSVKVEARRKQQYFLLLLAQRLELDFLIQIDISAISERELLSKQLKINNTMKMLRSINQISALHELLEHRVATKGQPRNASHKQELNDLVASELSLVSNTSFESFDIRKRHQLFQSSYLVLTGNAKSALHSFEELSRLFDDNKEMWESAPQYYLMAIEGILRTLRITHQYAAMKYYLDKLRPITARSGTAQLHACRIIFLYELLPLIDKGEFKIAVKHIRNNEHGFLAKRQYLNPNLNAEISLYLALAFLGNHEFQKAKKSLNRILSEGKNIFSSSQYRTIRLVYMMIMFEIHDYAYVDSERRSLKRELKIEKGGYKTERLMLFFFSNIFNAVSEKQKLRIWNKIKEDAEKLQHDPFEAQVLNMFNFVCYLESKLLRKPLGEILRREHSTDVDST